MDKKSTLVFNKSSQFKSSDKWCEILLHRTTNTGETIVSFTKEFRDTNYYAGLSRRANSTTTGGVELFIRGKTTTQFGIYSSGNTAVNCYVCGYLL